MSRATRLNSRVGALDLSATVVTLPAPNGADDTTAINAVLATSAGLTVRGRPGSVYQTTGPLIVRSGTRLDMTGCTVRLKSTASGNLLQNYAVGQTRRVLDAAMTSGSPILTSATGAFTGGDVGKQVRVERAGTGGTRLVTTIAAVTNSTTVTLAANAATTVTGQYASVGARDSDITIVGGVWDRQNTNSFPVTNTPDAHTLRFRHVDGLTVRDLQCAATGGKYAINPGDCSQVTVENIRFQYYTSDGVHLNGPCNAVTIRNIVGAGMGDDLVSMTATDTYTIITDCFGDITEVDITDVKLLVALPTLFSSGVKIVAGQNSDQTNDVVVANVRVRNVVAPTSTQPPVYIGDTNPIGGTGGVFRNIVVENVTSLGGSTGTVVLLHRGTMQDIRIVGVRPDPGDLYAVGVDTTIDRLTVRDLDWRPAGVSFVSGLQLTSTGNIDHLTAAGWRIACTGTSPAIFRLAASGSRISKLQLRDSRLTSTFSGSTINVAATGATLDTVQIESLITSGFAYPLGIYRGTTTVSADNVEAAGMTGWLYGTGSSAAVTVVGASGLTGDAPNAVNFDAPGYVRMAVGSTVFGGDRNSLTAGETTIARELSTSDAQITSGMLALTYFTARKTETCANVTTVTRATAAATPTLCRIGIYSVDSSDNLTLVASTSNDTTMWAGTFARYVRALSASFTKQAGQRYAVAIVYVGTTGPRISGCNPLVGGEAAVAPRISGSLSGQTDLPATITAGSITNSLGASLYTAVTP